MNPVLDQYVDFGYRIHPLRPFSKKPIFREWPQMDVVKSDLPRLWGGTGNNVGLICDGITVVDFDTGLDRAREWYAAHREILKTITLTRRGVHAWFRSSGEEWHGKHRDGEIRCEGKGYVVVPDSVVRTKEGEWQYRFVDGHPLVRPEELPAFRAEYVEKAERTRHLTREAVKHVDAYLKTIRSVQGENGSAALMRACYVCRDAGYSEAEGMVAILEWNETNAEPSWSREELVRAVTRAFGGCHAANQGIQ